MDRPRYMSDDWEIWWDGPESAHATLARHPDYPYPTNPKTGQRYAFSWGCSGSWGRSGRNDVRPGGGTAGIAGLEGSRDRQGEILYVAVQMIAEYGVSADTVISILEELGCYRRGTM